MRLTEAPKLTRDVTVCRTFCVSEKYFYDKTPQKAILYCQKLGLRLPVPSSETFENEILKLLRATYKFKINIWLGILKVNNKKRFSIKIIFFILAFQVIVNFPNQLSCAEVIFL